MLRKQLGHRIIEDKKAKMIASEHKHAPWRKSVLIPCWTVQLFFEVWNVALLSAGLALIAKDNYEVNGEEYSKPVINSFVPPSLTST